MLPVNMLFARLNSLKLAVTLAPHATGSGPARDTATLTSSDTLLAWHGIRQCVCGTSTEAWATQTAELPLCVTMHQNVCIANDFKASAEYGSHTCEHVEVEHHSSIASSHHRQQPFWQLPTKCIPSKVKHL
jgi:hypothetical protein